MPKSETIDVPPKWINLLPMFFYWLQEGTASQKQFAKSELTRLAKIADVFLQHRKHGDIVCACGEIFKLS